MQGRLGSLGRMDTMLPVVQNPPESMQIPLGLSLRMDIITSAVMEPREEKRGGEIGERGNKGYNNNHFNHLLITPCVHSNA